MQRWHVNTKGRRITRRRMQYVKHRAQTQGSGLRSRFIRRVKGRFPLSSPSGKVIDGRMLIYWCSAPAYIYWSRPGLHITCLSNLTPYLPVPLGMRLHVFMAFVATLQLMGGLVTSKFGVTVEEQAAIFLYTCVTGLSIRHVGERFQRSNETISG